MAQQDGSTTTTRGQPVPQTEDLEDDEVNLVNLDIINSGEIVTRNAALARDVINNSNVMDNTAADFLPQQYIPPQHWHDRPAPDRRVQQSQSQAVDVQRNSIQNPLRTPTLPLQNLHNHVDPKINFRAQNSQDNEFPQRSDYNLFTQADFPPLPSRFQPVTQQNVEINNLPFKLHSFSGNPEQDAEVFLNNFKLVAGVLDWNFDKQPGIFHMCLQGTAKIWFQQLDIPTSTNIEKIFSAFLFKFKPLGPDWRREACFLSLRQMPQENSKQFANRVLEQGTKLGKSDRDLLTQFIRGLPTPNRIHTIAQDTDTFDGATRIATLFETAQTFGQDDSTVTLQQQGTSVKEQNFNIVDSRILCAYCRKDGHHISECHHRQYNNHRRQHPYSAQWNRTQHNPPQKGPTNRRTNKLRSVYYDILCYNCNGTGHIARDCHMGKIQKPNLQGTNYHRPNFKKQGHPFRQENYYKPCQYQQNRENVYQGYRQSTFQKRDLPDTHSDRCRQTYKNSHLN